ncbi:MAG TPA: hypothetical protein PKG48_04360, partial [Bacteroidales bacterium]|nr:hypothetical protein [Bacteroidales bacterium]
VGARYRATTETRPVDHVPLYLIYFVYKTENNRYLIGKDFRFDPDIPFTGQILGWVDRDRVFDYNNRICFEPNYEETAVAFRRCNPSYAAKVFPFESDLERYLKGDSAVRPIWIEPDYYFFRNPDYQAGNPSSKETLELPEARFSSEYTDQLCDLGLDPVRIRRSKLLTGRPLPGNKFRFPLIRMDNLPENTFITGVTGRFENENKNRALLCDALKSHKSQVAVYFILDHTVDRNRLAYIIGQIEQEYTGLQKNFGVCFYPRLQLGRYRISLGENGYRQEKNNYAYARDFIRDFATDPRLEIRSDDALNTLKYVLTNESFDTRQVNILVIINNHGLTVSDPGLSGLRRNIRDLMIEKNCYLLAFDYRGDNELVRQLQEISVDAGIQYARRLDLPYRNIEFEQTGSGYELQNAGLLAIIGESDTSRLDAAQMQLFLKNGYDKIVNTISNAILQICQDVQKRPAGNHHEDPFLTALKDIPGVEGEVQYIRALEEGYASIRYRLSTTDAEQEIWKANVLMTKPELEAFGSLLDKVSVKSNNSTFSRSVYDLWTSLFNRFVGDNLPLSEILPMTPQTIMNRIIGASCGYALSDPLKRFSLEKILSNDQQVQSYFEDYRGKLSDCRDRIKEMLSTGRLKFNLDDDATRGNRTLSQKGICYYWVPMEILP